MGAIFDETASVIHAVHEHLVITTIFPPMHAVNIFFD